MVNLHGGSFVNILVCRDRWVAGQFVRAFRPTVMMWRTTDLQDGCTRGCNNGNARMKKITPIDPVHRFSSHDNNYLPAFYGSHLRKTMPGNRKAYLLLH